MHDESPDHYATLGLHRACTADEIKSAFRILSKAHHPDVNPSADARTLIQAINEAYRVLGHETRRADYDAARAAADREAAKRPAPPPIKQDLLLPLASFFTGATVRIEVRDAGHPDGFESYPLEIPSGTAPGARFRIQRHPPFSAGRIDVKVKLRPDRQFKAKGSDLRCDLRIDARRAREGGTASLRGPTGRPLTIRIPPRVERGAIVRVDGEGLPAARGGRGDLLVRIQHRPEVRIQRTGPAPDRSFAKHKARLSSGWP